MFKINAIQKVYNPNITPLITKISLQKKFIEYNLSPHETRTITNYLNNDNDMLNTNEWNWVCTATSDCNNASGYGVNSGCLGINCDPNEYTGFIEYLETHSGKYKGKVRFDYKVNAKVFWYVNGKKEGNVTLGFRTKVKEGDTCHFKLEVGNEYYDQIEGTIILESDLGTN